jgi:hypothetical protein
LPPGPHALQVHRTRTGLGRAVRTAHFGTTGAGYMGMFARQHARRAVLARPLRLEANPKPSHSSPPSLSLLRRAALAPWRSTPFWSDRAAQRPPPTPPRGEARRARLAASAKVAVSDLRLWTSSGALPVPHVHSDRAPCRPAAARQQHAPQCAAAARVDVTCMRLRAARQRTLTLTP